MSLAKAVVQHKTPNRLRIKFSLAKVREGYFDELKNGLASLDGVDRIEVNPLTKSALFCGKDLDLETIQKAGSEKKLFDLALPDSSRSELAITAVDPIKNISNTIRRLTAGKLDLPTVGFFTLLSVGLFQLAKGNFRSPPWYTAFWYAFGLFSKELAGRITQAEDQ